MLKWVLRRSKIKLTRPRAYVNAVPKIRRIFGTGRPAGYHFEGRVHVEAALQAAQLVMPP